MCRAPLSGRGGIRFAARGTERCRGEGQRSMIHEKSCGAIIYTVTEEGIRYLLVKNPAGIYGFAKGHMEAGETEQETALREVREETGLNVTLVGDFRREESYPARSKKDVMKDVVYFIATYSGQTPVYQKSELAGAELCSLEEAVVLFQFETRKRFIVEADEYLKMNVL